MKRRNISEELKINNDVTIDNGEDNKPEEEKEANELEKAAQKDIDDKHKLVDEIRDAEAPKATANDGLGKSLNIKQFVEKLTLEETSDDVLNEDFNDGSCIFKPDSLYGVIKTDLATPVSSLIGEAPSKEASPSFVT